MRSFLTVMGVAVTIFAGTLSPLSAHAATASAQQTLPEDLLFNPKTVMKQGGDVARKIEPPQLPQLIVGENVNAPPGWVRFCEDYTPVCKTTPAENRIVGLDAKARRNLQAVNDMINQQIRPMTDYKLGEPPTSGTCIAIAIPRERSPSKNGTMPRTDTATATSMRLLSVGGF